MSAIFHVLKDQSEAAFLEAAYRVAESCYLELDPCLRGDDNLRGDDTPAIAICCTENHLSTLDDLLWTFSPESFLPHSADNTPAPIMLSTEFIAAPVILNLTGKAPSLQYNTIHEIVGLSDEHTALCRERYKAYKKMGLRVTI